MKCVLVGLMVTFGGTALAAPPAGDLDGLGRALVSAIWHGDVEEALKRVPTRAELAQAGLARHASEVGYSAFLAKRRRGFGHVLEKFRRKHPSGCKTLSFSRLKKGRVTTIGTVSGLSSVDLFGRCDGHEIWLADPDGVFLSAHGYRVMEFN